MKIPYIRAKDKDTGLVHEGFYFEYPKTTFCFVNENRNVPTVNCLVTYKMVDWGLPNEPLLVSNIDMDSIEIVKYVEV